VLERADAVLGCDSGPLHLATAVGAPTVRVYGPTDSSMFGPWPAGSDQVVLRAMMPCSPCGHLANPPCRAIRHPQCLLEQTPESVLEALTWTLASRRRR
jgi:ADP-heptose:LPS heptosyltransferase